MQATLEAAERERGAAVQALDAANRDKQAVASVPPDDSPSQKAVAAMPDPGMEAAECLDMQGVEPQVAAEQVRCPHAAKKG